jgi:RNA polymerase sigma-70 factor (ECF subfamily)
MPRPPESPPKSVNEQRIRDDSQVLARGQATDDDRALLLRAGQGDESAVRRLYRAHVGKLLRHAGRILGPSDPDVEDVVQQAFLAALDGATRFDGRSSVQTWLFGIVTRRALDAARARYRRRRFSRVLESVGLSGGSQPAPDRAYQAADEVERALAELAPMQRVVFVLHDVEGYTFAEISGLTDVGISTLHGRLLAARKCIDAHLAKTNARSGSRSGSRDGGDDA